MNRFAKDSFGLDSWFGFCVHLGLNFEKSNLCQTGSKMWFELLEQKEKRIFKFWILDQKLWSIHMAVWIGFQKLWHGSKNGCHANISENSAMAAKKVATATVSATVPNLLKFNFNLLNVNSSDSI